MKVIVAPLNWGLGHASRCAPIIQKLIESNFIPVIASDGQALEFLSKEFPHLESIELPSYGIEYKRYLKFTLFFKLFRAIRVRRLEYQLINQFISNNDSVVGIISDNRFGVFSHKVPTVYITHQTKVLSGWLTSLTSLFHRRFISKFDECWIPDDKKLNLSGVLSETLKIEVPVKWIGILTRFRSITLKYNWDLTVLLSGPEPRRSLIESKIIRQFQERNERILLIRGVVESTQKWSQVGNLKTVNYLLAEDLNTVLNASKKVVARSGYSSIMDLCALEKEVVFLPTQGQNEQEYLAKVLKEQFGVQYVDEKEIDKTDFLSLEFKKLPKALPSLDHQLFDLFKSERKF